jgi:hypothetical protein
MFRGKNETINWVNRRDCIPALNHVLVALTAIDEHLKMLSDREGIFLS